MTHSAQISQIYISCTEEATEMAAKYLHNKKCVFKNFEK